MTWKKLVTRKQNLILMWIKAISWKDQLNKEIGVSIDRMIYVCRNSIADYYIDEDCLVQINKKLQGLNPKLPKRGMLLFKKALHTIQQISKKDFSRASDKALANYFQRYVTIMRDAIPYLLLPTIIDDILPEKIMQFVKNHAHLLDLSAMSMLSYTGHEELDLLELVREVKKDGFTPAVMKKIQSHNKRYLWIFVQSDEQPLTVDDQIMRIYELLKTDVEQRIEFLQNYPTNTQKKKEHIFKEIGGSKELKKLVVLYEQWVMLKDFRRAVISQERALLRGLYDEIGKRIGFTGLEVTFLIPGEITDALLNGKMVDKKLPKERMRFCVVEISPEKIAVFVGEEAQRIASRIEQKECKQKTLSGMTAYPGIAQGKAKIIWKAEDSAMFKEGDILVTSMTTPQLVPLMQKAAAIVTDEGGLLCHAAIISRELKKPCIIGTGNATKILRDGEKIEVDATKGIVRKIG